MGDLFDTPETKWITDKITLLKASEKMFLADYMDNPNAPNLPLAIVHIQMHIADLNRVRAQLTTPTP